MDEVRMVRDGYPEPAPPTAQVIAQAKALLNEPPRRSLPRLWWGLGGVVAAGAAATVAITLVGGNAVVGGNTPVGGGAVAQPSSVNLDAKGAILAAAEKAEQQPIGVRYPLGFRRCRLGHGEQLRPGQTRAPVVAFDRGQVGVRGPVGVRDDVVRAGVVGVVAVKWRELAAMPPLADLKPLDV